MMGNASQHLRWFAALVLALAMVAYGLDRLFPPNLERYLERSTVVLDADGDVLRAFTTTDGMWRLHTSADDVDENFIAMLVAFEDQRFYHHPGVDPFAILRGLGQWVHHGRPVSGASTLTMQAARLLEPRPRTLRSKVLEMARAVQLEWRFSKREILDIYLTLAPYGGNIEGLRAASLAYYEKEPSELSPSQSAVLIALPRAPERLRPDRYAHRLEVERNAVLMRIADAGALAQQVAEEAQEDPVPSARARLPFRSPHLARRLRQLSEEGASVRAHINGRLQDAVERIAGNHAATSEHGASMAALVVENATGNVVAYLGSSDFWSGQGQVDVVTSLRSPGSTLKPFIYGLAFEDLALHPETLIDDRAVAFGAYEPHNFDRTHMGDVSVRTALQMSLNVPAVAVLDEVGPMRLAARLRQAGIELDFGRLQESPSLPLALGGVGVSLEDLTAAYVAIARGGDRVPLRFTDAGPALEEDASRRLLSEVASWYVTDILREAPLPEGFGQAQSQVRGQDIAFKTGTSYGYRDAWAFGYSPAYTVGIWVGRPDGSPRPGHYGRNTAAPLLFEVFDQLEDSGTFQLAPEGAIAVRSRGDLPRQMQVFSSHQASEGQDQQVMVPPLQIAFPPNGAVFELPRASASFPMRFRANGGAGRLRWLVDGEPLSQDFNHGTEWLPREPGFVRVAVVDEAGRSAESVIRVNLPASSPVDTQTGR